MHQMKTRIPGEDTYLRQLLVFISRENNNCMSDKKKFAKPGPERAGQ